MVGSGYPRSLVCTYQVHRLVAHRILTSLRSSLSHGTPPNIISENHDVPSPKSDMFLAANAPTAHRSASVSFVYLCRLTSILGDMLPLVYSLKPNYKDAWKTIRRVECALDEWEDDLREHSDGAGQGNVQGTNMPCSSGLWFCYLTLRLMLKRLAFRVRSTRSLTTCNN
jgi:hypothetical protein